MCPSCVPQVATFEMLGAPPFDPDWTYDTFVQAQDGTFTGSGHGTWECCTETGGAYTYQGGTTESMCTAGSTTNGDYVYTMVNYWYTSSDMEEGMKAVSCSYTIFDIAAGTIEKKNAKMVDHVPLDFVAGACPPTYEAALDGIEWMSSGVEAEDSTKWRCVENCRSTQTWDCSQGEEDDSIVSDDDSSAGARGMSAYGIIAAGFAVLMIVSQ